ncbi:DUF2309 domain-containing protein [Fodinibius sp.]|uniref:DUF2309 domain-containing protein n=1 Tax=Fodinibius sp. TaxID=1872440 RepID=UPI002ACE54E2|nr:DUF2309 domain-containing protein [Fodinibius sp.]MDZ7660582.1 DUF2309 domain-containing protein [Fodinibius sp.]
MKKETITASIRALSDQLPSNWPLYSFVTSNPLSGLENLRFEEAISRIRKDIGIEGYPSAKAFKQAWEKGAIDRSILERQLQDRGITFSAEESLWRIQDLESQSSKSHLLGDVDRQLIKWLTVFLDEGSTEWSMPNRDSGFYKAWQSTARFDPTLPNRQIIRSLPDEPLEAIQHLTSHFGSDDLEPILKHHLFALPGWVGYIKYRIENPSDWQKAYPITMKDYLAVRLALCSMLDSDLTPSENPVKQDRKELDKLKLAWLTAMERTYQETLINQVKKQALIKPNGTKKIPDAQFVFCIDTRSERIRRAVEKAGNYETFGYAGFFGVAMEYIHPEKEIRHKSCPPILDAELNATEQVRKEDVNTFENFDYYNSLKKAIDRLIFSLKNNIPASFGYVESTGFFYALSMLVRTLAPNLFHRIKEYVSEFIGHPEYFSDIILSSQSSDNLQTINELSATEKAEIAKSAFELMGWEEFSDLVVFAGHGSQTANNPYASALDCGACAGNKGRHNARALADICNDKKVRKLLTKDYDITIPEDTLFLAAEHNTTTNHIHLFDEKVPERFAQRVKQLKNDLRTAQNYANYEQFDILDGNQKASRLEAARRASDWAETRPEWGLAGNASFIIAPRELTANLNLEARSFLHSYDWQKDSDGKKLEAILQGPMVVTQWINNHYYFATVDNEKFGSGTKVTQNVTGKYGVVQGNGGDLKFGLPLESLHEDEALLEHLPLRLTVVIYAPEQKVKSIFASNQKTLGKLIENEWIHLAVLDPQKETVRNSLWKNSETSVFG